MITPAFHKKNVVMTTTRREETSDVDLINMSHMTSSENSVNVEAGYP